MASKPPSGTSGSPRSKSVVNALRDFSTNLSAIHYPTLPTQSTSGMLTTSSPYHPSISFEDGNLVLRAGYYCFLVHQGVLCRASPVFADLLSQLKKLRCIDTFDGHPVLSLSEEVDDLVHLLRAIYDGLSYDQCDSDNFTMLSALLRLTTKYRIERLRSELLEDLSSVWPTTLEQWDLRERGLLNGKAELLLEKIHPILLINLARDLGERQFLPAAFYDLSRQLPSRCVSGFMDASGKFVTLQADDITSMFRGREHASRFLSTFIVNSLEGRDIAPGCLNRGDSPLSRRRTCRTAFEATTFELLKRNNGLAEDSVADPLFAMAESFRIQTRDDLFTAHGVANPEVYQACEICRTDLGMTVARARQAFWRNLPDWFGISVQATEWDPA